MGSPQTDLDVFHFSHPHPLELTTPPTTGNASCFGCNLNVTSGKSYYECKSCNFCLHCFCYKLPIMTYHPAHSTHDLVLLVIRSSPETNKDALNCLACGHHVKAFCYHCAECSIYFHTFCLALPLSLSITYHPHPVKLEFSPPYDFFCDLCKKPSYNGWLYRCNLCEFDTHLACAVQNLEPHSIRHPSFSQSSNLLKKITSATPQVNHVRFSGGVSDGSGSSAGYEIMHLIAQQIVGDVRRSNGQDDFGSAVIGWDKRISSPRESGKKTKIVELQGTEPSPARKSANLEERTPLRDTPSSYQFSDACFSIDLTKSYSGTRGVTQLKGTNRMRSNSGEGKEPFGVVNWPSFNSYNDAGQQNKPSASFLNGGRTSAFGESSQRALNYTNTNSDSERYSSRSGWRKCLSCCL